MKRTIRVPIYDCTVFLVVARDSKGVVVERRRMGRVFGEDPDLGDSYCGLTSRDGNGRYGLFLSRKHLSMELIGHEVWHLTHRILERCSIPVDPDHHEAGAYLHGWLMQRICSSVLKRGKDR